MNSSHEDISGWLSCLRDSTWISHQTKACTPFLVLQKKFYEHIQQYHEFRNIPLTV